MKRDAVVDIVFNPNAGRGLAPPLAARVSELLFARGMTARRHTIGDFLSNDIDGQRDCVVTLGGDGTVRAVVEGLSSRFGERSPPVAVVALGTANLVARHLKLPWSADAGLPLLVDAIAARKTYAIDLPAANGKPFLLMCSAGFDAQIVHEVAARRSGPITMLHYLPALGRSVLKLNVNPLSVEVDGKPIFGPRPALVVVANVAEYGTGFSLNPSATSNDGVLDVTIFKADAHGHLFRTALHAVTGLVEEGAAVVMKGRRVDIGGAGAPAQIDGEAFGHTPIRIGLLPHRQNFIVPA